MSSTLERYLATLDRMGELRTKNGNDCEEASLLNEELVDLWDDLDPDEQGVAGGASWRSWPPPIEPDREPEGPEIP